MEKFPISVDSIEKLKERLKEFKERFVLNNNDQQ